MRGLLCFRRRAKRSAALEVAAEKRAVERMFVPRRQPTLAAHAAELQVLAAFSRRYGPARDARRVLVDIVAATHGALPGCDREELGERRCVSPRVWTEWIARVLAKLTEQVIALQA